MLILERFARQALIIGGEVRVEVSRTAPHRVWLRITRLCHPAPAAARDRGGEENATLSIGDCTVSKRPASPSRSWALRCTSPSPGGRACCSASTPRAGSGCSPRKPGTISWGAKAKVPGAVDNTATEPGNFPVTGPVTDVIVPAMMIDLGVSRFDPACSCSETPSGGWPGPRPRIRRSSACDPGPRPRPPARPHFSPDTLPSAASYPGRGSGALGKASGAQGRGSTPAPGPHAPGSAGPPAVRPWPSGGGGHSRAWPGRLRSRTWPGRRVRRRRRRGPTYPSRR